MDNIFREWGLSMSNRMLSIEVIVLGVVQGVGFRPFIKRIALKSKVYGYVKNMGGGEVIIRIEGHSENIKEFFKRFWREKPLPAQIMNIRVVKKPYSKYDKFEIVASESKLLAISIIPPDIGICRDCTQEINENTRWKNYPFNSCAWCGPRFSMMYKSPYDRENTSMHEFPLCKYCISEYNDVSNIRRFHAQGISCPLCGPKIWLTDNKGSFIEVSDPILEAAKLIDENYILGIKGIGGFHIACRADDDQVIINLRERKERPEKPLALMVRDIGIAEKIAILDEQHIELLASPQRPILLLKRREDAPISKLVAPGLDTIGIMLPYSGIHYLLLRNFDHGFMVMTSGNLYNKPMEIKNSSAIKRLGKIVDYFLMHNREIVNRVDDSVIRFTDKNPIFLRRSRGYAPKWLLLNNMLKKPIIAFGADLQNVGAIAVGDKVIPTQFIGDADQYENLVELDKYLKWFIKIYKIELSKSILVADKHPRYYSRFLADQWSIKYNVPIYYVQHHFAHGYSILCEYKEEEGVIIAMDGAGYGDDDQIWGGEVLYVYEEKMKRLGHLEYHVMPGGDLATYYPIRMLISILSGEYGVEKAINTVLNLGLDKYLRGPDELDAIKIGIKYGRPMTSSTGRLLDAVSTLLGICGYRSYEGEPAMKLEAYTGNTNRLYEDMEPKMTSSDPKVVITSRMVKTACEILENGDKRGIAYTAQYYIGYYLGLIASKYADKIGQNYIYISGGAAVNSYIYRGISDAAKNYGLTIRLHKELPPGDGCISTGQAYYISLNNYII